MINNKQLTTAFLILLLTVSMISIFNIQPVTASKKSYAIIGAVPNPIGVGQETLLTVGITEALQSKELQWKGLTVTVTKPDGTTETLGPFNTDSTGATGAIFVPSEVGEYTLQTHFPAQWQNYTGMGFFGPTTFSEFYEASDSEVMTLIVQEDPVKIYPGNPLPSEYWTRPIDSQLREWYTLAGSWLFAPDNKFAPFNDAPDSPHILWTKELTFGGLVGGDVGLISSTNQGPVGMGIGDAYEGKWGSQIILNGRLYYAERSGGGFSLGYPEPIVYHCVDLHTGKEYWTKTFGNNETLAFGQLLYWQSMNYQGTYAYLWSTSGGYNFFTGTFAPSVWKAYDAYTGDLRITINNPPSGTTLRGEKGELYILQTDFTKGWMALWNMSALASTNPNVSMKESWGLSTDMKTFNIGNDAASQALYAWNKTIPTNLQGSVVKAYFGDMLFGSNLGGGFGASTAPSNVKVWGISLKEGQEGQLLFNSNWNAPSEWIQGNQSVSWAAYSVEDKVAVLWDKELRAHYGVSLETGKLIWGPSKPQYYLDIYEGTQLTSHFIAYGKLYASGVSGILYCYDVKTGELLWTYEAQDPYTEMLWNNNWWLGITFISDGKVYVGSAEHSPNQPLPRGAPFACVNATDGTLLWRINGIFRQTGWGGLAIIGDSVIATMDTYDQRVYAIGKGPSSMTLNAPLSGVKLGDSVTLCGTIIDNSPGTASDQIKLRFSNGVPVVSDESMNDWMLYVYKQFARPLNATGVPIELYVLDSNENYRSIGTTVSDANGFFSFSWEPDIEGSYTVYASFEGSNSYWPSRAVAAFTVDPAAATPAPQPTQAPSLADQYILPGIIGIIITIIVCFAIAILLLRKKQ